ncbi:hypothetical protein DDE82_003724 [Stemphylium lycopersici]|nr:hypothetical protein DDE82_003724 [Stemphylium lycopersici]
MSHMQYEDSQAEGWQSFISWDGELYDPFFQGETDHTGAHGGSYGTSPQLSGSYTSEPPYLVSTAPSVTDLPPSLEYTAVSASPSVQEEQFSLGQAYDTALSFETTATSPLAIHQDSRYYGSFGACGNAIRSPLGNITESPILDTRYERIPEAFSPSTGSLESTTETVFNPYVTGSSHSFSGLDVRASRVFSNLGAWADQPRIVEPIAEDDWGTTEVAPIPIPQSLPQSYNSMSSSHPRSDQGFGQTHRSMAITIPETARGPTSYNNRANVSGFARRVSPVLSVSPVASRHPRTTALSRSASNSRRKTTTPSPTSDSYGWVAYHPNPLTNRLAPTNSDGMSGRAPKGRKRPLTPQQRRDAALMRLIGSCSNCQRRKEKCDPGMPCKACLEHYKGDLVNHPCRDHTLCDLSATFLSDRLGWHPTTRSLESFIPTGHFEISTGITYTVPLNFGFGPAFPVSVNAVQLDDGQPIVHDHIIYSWPPKPSSGSPHRHAVLPAVLTADSQAHLSQTLDSHLSLLVTHHFRAFPLYCSPLRILREVYVFSRSIPTNTQHYRVLHQALKLLVLVHVGGDITLPSRSESPILTQLIYSTMNIAEDLTPTPCFIRSQFGAIMPELAQSLMKDVLSSLEQLLLNKDCDEWPITLAVLITVLMTVESVHYHAAKLPYHNSYGPTNLSSAEKDLRFNEEKVKELLNFYSACFSGCHARLRPDWEGESFQSHSAATSENKFIEGLREATRQANEAGYLVIKAKETTREDDDDMSYFFDRLVARLLKP